MSQRRAVALFHLAYEGVGVFGPTLRRRGWDLAEVDAPLADEQAWRAAEAAPLLIVMGGPIGAYDDGPYPYLRRLLAVLEARAASDAPTLGVCLGAQLMARALGARVYPGPAFELGWSSLILTRAGAASPLAALVGRCIAAPGSSEGGAAVAEGAETLPVLHWHGDTFDLPPGARLLASSALYRHQGFARGSWLGLQFHGEVTAPLLEPWYIGAARQLQEMPGLEVADLRAASARHAPAVAPLAAEMLERWLTAVGVAP